MEQMQYSAIRKEKEVHTMIISNEYKNEYGPFLYEAMLILDNYASKRTSKIFVLLVNVNE